MPARKGGSLLNRAINALPIELHIPGYRFCGPGTRLEERLARGDRGINPLDTACREHDIAYSHSTDLSERHVADRILAERARQRITARDSTFGEKAAATAVWAAMKAKTKMGMGMKPRKRKIVKKRVLPVAKRGGILPLLPLLGVVGSLAGGAAGIAKAVNDTKAAQRQLEEMQRHHRALEGRGLYLAPYKRGRGVSTAAKRKKKTLKKR